MICTQKTKSPMNLSVERSISDLRWLSNTRLTQYTACINVWGGSFLTLNHHKHKNWVPSILTHNLRLIFMGMKQKKILKKKKKIKLTHSKKCVFQNRQFSKCFLKILEIGPWVSRINGCQRHWCSSTYMVERLSNALSNTGKKCVFCVFRLLLPLSSDSLTTI